MPAQLLPEVRPFGGALRRDQRGVPWPGLDGDPHRVASRATNRRPSSARTASTRRRGRAVPFGYGGLPAHERRRAAQDVAARAALDGGVDARGRDGQHRRPRGAHGVRARGQRLHRRRAGPVAARRPGHHREGGRGRGARALPVARQRRRSRSVPAPLAGLGARHWRPDARGLIAGITRGTTKAHLARAALEAIALQNVDLLRAMQGRRGARHRRACARRRQARRPTTSSCSCRSISSGLWIFRPRGWSNRRR